MYRTYNLASSRDRPNQLVISERSYFRDSILSGYETLGGWTGHKLCCGTVPGYTILNKLANWADKRDTVVHTLDVTREDITALKWPNQTDDWWPGDPEED